MAIPVVDLCDLGLHNEGQPSAATVERVSKEFDIALSTVGFVYIKNHGVSDKLMHDFYEATRRFFTLPREVKEKYTRDTSLNEVQLSSNGYVAPGREILEDPSLHELREAYDVTSVDGKFPDQEAPNLRPVITRLFNDLCQLTNRLLLVLATGLGLEADYFISRHVYMGKGNENNATTFRTLYYPSIEDGQAVSGVVRCGQHSDYGTVTLLLQDNLGGLEILTEGKWIPATPIPDTILVNVGDLMQFWTGDRYLATVHRVLVPDEELKRRSPRQSLAFFVHPDNEVLVSSLDGSEKRPAISAIAHLKERYSQTYKY